MYACHASETEFHLSALPASQPAESFDLLVNHPIARFVRGRPAWRLRADDRPVDVPPALRKAYGRRVAARPLGEPDASVPTDEVAIRLGTNIALVLPPGRYRTKVIDVGAGAARVE